MRSSHRYSFLAVAVGLVAAAAFAYASISGSAVAQRPMPQPDELAKKEEPIPPGTKTEIATFAAGCFWCVEADFDKVPGVLKTTPGYTGGHTSNPTYELVSTGTTGHAEALEVVYDPTKVSYQKLLTWYWRHVDPTDASGQFCDRGSEYRPIIFVHSAEQRRLAEASKAELEKSGIIDKPIAVKIVDAATFTPAEREHHDYYLKNPWRYSLYRHGCGRDQRLKQIWGKAGL
ncbi:MAG: peptide-methionine (S)-S-oxide reductase MsrA [Hyphomicrobiaceae bacterium]